MGEERSLRETFKEFDKEFRKEMREAEKAWAMAHGVLYTCVFTIASIKLTDGAQNLLMNKLAKIGTVLAFKAELMALEKGKTSIDKATMKKVLDELEAE